MDVVDYFVCFFGEEVGVEWEFWYQFGDEGFVVDFGEVVGLGEFYFEEVLVEVFLEW